jgi:beta-N-acetylhexosaminidase
VVLQHLQRKDAKMQKRSSLFFLCVFAAVCLCVTPALSRAQPDPLAGLTLEQRIGQMFLVHLSGSTLNAVGRDFLAQWQPGGLVLMDGNTGDPAAVTRLTNSYQQAVTDAGGLPLFIAADQEGGPIAALETGFTHFPTPALLTAAGDSALAERIGAAVAAEMRAVGLNLNLAPVADLENPDNKVLARRTFGSDPALTGPTLAAFIRGSQTAGVIATAKHFPGHGATSADSHAVLPVSDLPRERLETVELVPFRSAIDAGVEAIMAAHIWYPALEPDANIPASLSDDVLTGLLREQMGFDGLIMTDALDMDAVDTRFSLSEAVFRAVNAGADILLSAHIGPQQIAAAMADLAERVRRGDISEERINQSARRILTVKARYGILDWQPLDPATATQRVLLDDHAALLETLFQAGVTAAYDHHNLIPLRADHRIAIIFLATRYQIVNECQRYRSDIRWSGVSDSPSDEEIGWAADAARSSDVVVVFTQNAIENRRQQQLVQALPPEKTVVVALWSPYDWLAFPQIAAYMVTYSPARPAVPAACALLFGAAPAQGRLAISLSPDLMAGARDS